MTFILEDLSNLWLYIYNGFLSRFFHYANMPMWQFFEEIIYLLETSDYESMNNLKPLVSMFYDLFYTLGVDAILDLSLIVAVFSITLVLFIIVHFIKLIVEALPVV